MAIRCRTRPSRSASRDLDGLLAVGEAVLVELPLAAAAIWLAVALTRDSGPGPAYRVSALSAAPAYSSAARQQYQAATDR